jgi:profilin
VQFTAKEQADIRAVATKLSVIDRDDPQRDEALSGVRAGGIHIRGNKFMFTRNDYRSIRGTRKVRSTIHFVFCMDTDWIRFQTPEGPSGFIIVRTVKTIIVAEYVPPHQAGEALPVAENVADYLISTDH